MASKKNLVKTLNIQKVIQDCNLSKRITSSAIFTIIGWSIAIAPWLKLKEFDANFIIATLFCFLVFGLPFGIIWGLKKMIKTLKLKKAIKNMQFSIIEDEVVAMREMGHESIGNQGKSNAQLMFKKYSEATGKNYIVFESTFRKTKEGDIFYLFYINDLNHTFMAYRKKDYDLDPQLTQKLNK